MRFIFDPKKRLSNLKKHGCDFDDARSVIESGATLTFEDRRFDYGEERFVTIGPLREKLVVIVTTETEEEIRIISMREATKDEKAIYQEHL